MPNTAPPSTNGPVDEFGWVTINPLAARPGDTLTIEGMCPPWTGATTASVALHAIDPDPEAPGMSDGTRYSISAGQPFRVEFKIAKPFERTLQHKHLLFVECAVAPDAGFGLISEGQPFLLLPIDAPPPSTTSTTQPTPPATTTLPPTTTVPVATIARPPTNDETSTSSPWPIITATGALLIVAVISLTIKHRRRQHR